MIRNNTRFYVDLFLQNQSTFISCLSAPDSSIEHRDFQFIALSNSAKNPIILQNKIPNIANDAVVLFPNASISSSFANFCDGYISWRQNSTNQSLFLLQFLNSERDETKIVRNVDRKQQQHINLSYSTSHSAPFSKVSNSF